MKKRNTTSILHTEVDAIGVLVVLSVSLFSGVVGFLIGQVSILGLL